MEHHSQNAMTSRMVGIVGATGAQIAIPIILGDLPGDFCLPIVVVFAIHQAYLRQFAARLSSTSRLPVIVVEDGQIPKPGTVHIAGTERRLFLEQGRFLFQDRDPHVHDAMATFFHSMARELAERSVAVVLSGLGENCAAGVKAVRDAGGYTIAQDEASSVVYGMARSAVQLGAVCEILPDREIAPRLVALAT